MYVPIGLGMAVVWLMLAAIRIGKNLAAQNALVFAIKIIVALSALSHKEALGGLVEDGCGKGDETDVANGVAHGE